MTLVPRSTPPKLNTLATPIPQIDRSVSPNCNAGTRRQNLEEVARLVEASNQSNIRAWSQLAIVLASVERRTGSPARWQEEAIASLRKALQCLDRAGNALNSVDMHIQQTVRVLSQGHTTEPPATQDQPEGAVSSTSTTQGDPL